MGEGATANVKRSETVKRREREKNGRKVGGGMKLIVWVEVFVEYTCKKKHNLM